MVLCMYILQDLCVKIAADWAEETGAYSLSLVLVQKLPSQDSLPACNHFQTEVIINDIDI